MKSKFFESLQINKASMSQIKGGSDITDPDLDPEFANAIGDTSDITDPEIDGLREGGVVGIGSGILPANKDTAITDPEIDG